MRSRKPTEDLQKKCIPIKTGMIQRQRQNFRTWVLHMRFVSDALFDFIPSYKGQVRSVIPVIARLLLPVL